MKKKLPIFAAVLALSVSLAACGGQKESELSENNTAVAEEIVEIVDDYLDGKLDKNDTVDILQAAQDELDEGGDDEVQRISVDSNTVSITLDLIGVDEDDVDTSDIIEKRNKIAEKAGLDKRKK